MRNAKSLIIVALSPVFDFGCRHWRVWRQPFAKVVHGGTQYCCSVCRNGVRQFVGQGKERLCPVCGAAERSRVDWTFLRTKIAEYGDKRIRMLHVAPEHYLQPRFRKMRNIDYVSVDLSSPLAMVKMDITDLRFPDNSFDLIYCSHVLEHVVEDRKAMAEFSRVLKPDGFALLQVPMSGAITFEDWSVTSPEERRKVFGDPGHVRRYGMDYVERLRESGLTASVLTASDILSETECNRMGVALTRRLFWCTKDCDGRGVSRSVIPHSA